MFTQNDIHKYLEQTLFEAEKAFDVGNYPIGSVIVDENGKMMVKIRNRCTSSNDLTAHAEILALQKLGNKISKDEPGNYYLFSSLEPCYGCSFFLTRTNIKTVYSALKDPHRKGGLLDLKNQPQFDHFFENIEVINEPFPDLAKKSLELMKNYFLKIGNLRSARYYGHES